MPNDITQIRCDNNNNNNGLTMTPADNDTLGTNSVHQNDV